MNTKIKKANLSDLDVINHIMGLSKAYWDYDEEFVNKFMKKLGLTAERLQISTTLLFYLEDKIIGFYNFIINEDNTLELDNFFLHPEHIGKGLGRKLWDAACDTAKELGRTEFIIWSDPNAENFYLKMGCRKIGVRPSPMMPNRYPPVLKYEISE